MKNVKFITTVRKTVVDKSTFIILAANKKNILKNYNVKKTYLEHQVLSIKENFENSEIIVVTGQDHNKILKLKNNFRIVENVNYFDVGDFESIRLGLQNSETNHVYIISDVVVDTPIKSQKDSSVYVTSKETKTNPGCIINEYIDNIDYGLPNEIIKVFLFANQELEILKKYILENQKTKYKYTAFEIVNQIISRGGKFRPEFVS